MSLPATQTSGLRIEHVSRLRLADFVFPPAHPLAERSGVVYGYAVRHAAGAFLFDTGIGEGHPWVDAHYRPRVRPILEALGEIGIRPEEVVGIANSHLHFDHCGQNRRFGGVPVYAQRAEREAARAEGYTVPEWVEFEGARYELLDGDAEPLPGIRLLATPGHTRGHQSAAIATREGLVLLVGHAVYSLSEWQGEDAPLERSAAAVRSARRLRALGARRVYFGHDERIWGTA